MASPSNLRYTKDHEWARPEADGTVTVGLTDHAQEALGDVVFVDLPAVGKTLSAGDTVGVVESVKTVSDVYAPCGGEVVEVNAGLKDKYELINQDAYGQGWLVRLRPGAGDSLAGLMDAAAYDEYLATL